MKKIDEMTKTELLNEIVADRAFGVSDLHWLSKMTMTDLASTVDDCRKHAEIEARRSQLGGMS